MLVKCFNRGDGSYRSISLALKGTTQMPRVRRLSPCARRGLGLGHTEKLGGKFLSVLRAIPASHWLLFRLGLAFHGTGFASCAK